MWAYVYLMTLGVVFLTGIALTVFKERTTSPRDGAIMCGLIIASGAMEIASVRKYNPDLNTLSLICTIAALVMFFRRPSVSDRVKAELRKRRAD